MRALLLNIPAFFATTFLLAMVPGQGVAMVLRQSILGGRKAAFYSVIGNSTGLFIWGTCSAVGLSVIFAQSETAYSILKWSGVAFLFFLSIQTLWTLKNVHGKFDLNLPGKSSPWAAFRLGLITNLTNVKAAVFAVAFIPQFVPKDFNLGWGIFLLSIVQALTSASWYSFLISIIGRATTVLARPKVRRGLTAFSALGILFLAATLLLTSPR